MVAPACLALVSWFVKLVAESSLKGLLVNNLELGLSGLGLKGSAMPEE